MHNQIALIIPAPSPTLKGHYKNLRQIKQDVLAQCVGGKGEDGGWHLDRLRCRNIYSPASVFCVLGLREDLGLCIFLIVICG